MSWKLLFMALGLMLVLEGVLPFLSPDRWRQFVQSLAQQTDKSIRITGFVCMLVGMAIVVVIHQFVL